MGMRNVNLLINLISRYSQFVIAILIIMIENELIRPLDDVDQIWNPATLYSQNKIKFWYKWEIRARKILINYWPYFVDFQSPFIKISLLKNKE